MLLSIHLSLQPSSKDHKLCLALVHILFQMGLVMNLLVVVIYWCFIRDFSNFEGIQLVHLITVHLFPALAFLFNWHLTDVVLFDGHNKGLLVLGLIYMCVNAEMTIATGKPLYWFLTWEDYKSPLICLSFIAATYFVFGALVKVSQKMKPHMSSTDGLKSKVN